MRVYIKQLREKTID